jgi:ferredoxin
MTSTTRTRPARAAKSLEIDWTRCDGHGLCAQLLPDRIGMDEWGFPIVRATDVRSDEKQVRRAVAACPALALRIETTPAPPPRPRR